MHITNTETRMGLIEDKALASRSRRGTTSLRVLYRSLGFALQTLAANVQRTIAQRQIGLSQLLSPWDGTEHKHSDTLTCAIVICEFLKIVFFAIPLGLNRAAENKLSYMYCRETARCFISPPRRLCFHLCLSVNRIIQKRRPRECSSNLTDWANLLAGSQSLFSYNDEQFTVLCGY